MKKQLKVSGVFLCLLVLALVLALYYSFVYTGLSQKTNTLSAQHTSDTQLLESYREMGAQESAIRSSIDGLKTKVKASASELGIPASGLRGDLEKGLSGAGITATGITMSDASAGKKTPSDRTMTQVTITVTADCTEQQLSSLLQYFEHGTQAVYAVNSVGMNAKDKQGKGPGGQYTVSLNMTAYYLTAAAGAGQ